MKKSLALALATATLALCACGGGKDRAAIPTNDNEVVEKVADAAILLDVSGVTFTTAKVNDVYYGDILYPAISFRVKAKMDGVESPDKDGIGYVTSAIAWEFDSNWNVNSEGPDAAHYRATETSEAKAALKGEGATPINSSAKATITFGKASKVLTFSFKLLVKE